MRLGAVDPYGDLGAGGTKLLEESAVSPDPQVLLCDLHLRRENENREDAITRSLPQTYISLARQYEHSYLRHTGTQSRAWCPGREEASRWRSYSP